MTIAFVVGGVALIALALLLQRRSGRSPADQVDAFAAARQVTNRWSADPSSAPAPVRDYVEQQTRRSEPEPQQVDGAGSVTP